jgi:diguanylate cyclase (GGDEF)-like protein/PAS domain S-box-containing protein
MRIKLPPDPSHRFKSVLSRIRAALPHNSIRTRYLAIATLFVVALTVAGGYTGRIVEHATYQGEAHVQERQQIRVLLRDLTDDVWGGETALRRYLLVPEKNSRREMENRLQRAAMHADRLKQFNWILTNASNLEQVDRLIQQLGALQKETAHLIEVRNDHAKLFPALPTMTERMLPAYTAFYTAASLATDDFHNGPKTPHLSDSYLLFADSRLRSTLLTSSFRNWVIARFGIFDEPEKTMFAQSRDIAAHLGTLQQNLSRLTELDRRGQLELVQQDALQKMRRELREWVTAYQDVTAIILSERWRSDTPLLRDVIQPLFEKSWMSLRALDTHVEAYAIEDISALSRIAATVSKSIWWMALAGIVITVIGFVLLELSISRPIAGVARALREEAQGSGRAEIPHATMLETRNLVIAFDHMREQVRSRQERLQTILNNAGEGIITFDTDGRIEGFNHAAESLFGWSEADILGKSLGTLISADLAERRENYFEHFLRSELGKLIGREGELLGRHRDGTVFPMAVKISRMTLLGREMHVALVADISERKAMLQHLKDMAEHDGLTGLYNRSYFQGELERVVERSRRDPGQCAALLYVDLDNFKYVNDTLGHAAGDRLLLEISALLNRRLRKTDLLARLGGDEFAVLLYNARQETAMHTADALRRRLAEYAFRERGEAIDIGCSIGVALVDANTKSAEEALSQADLACYLAKRGGRNRAHLFQAADAANAKTMSLDMGWSRRIKEAIERSRFLLACQPIVNVSTRQVVSFEVLIRMRDEDGTIIMPGGFLPAAERFGLSTDIDKWVIVNAIRALKLQQDKLPELHYSINLSGSTLSDLGVCDLIQQQLRLHALDPASLTFEVTETVAIADIPVAEAFLSRLQAIGCKTALDDFGSGMASFAYLKDLPVNVVKIDGRFVRNLASNPVDQAMVKAMNDIAHALGKQTVGEFVESQESLEVLASLGVDYAQGYYLGRPDITYPCEAIAELAGTDKLCLAPGN